MGYYTRITGEITLDPPLTYSEVKRWRARQDVSHYSLILKTDEKEVETDEGVLTRTTGVAIVPCEESFKAYSFTDTVQRFASLFGKDRTFTGRFEARGEDSEDWWRLEIRNAQVVTTRGWVTWPEDFDGLRKAWARRVSGDQATDAYDLYDLRGAVTEFLDLAHRKAAEPVE